MESKPVVPGEVEISEVAGTYWSFRGVREYDEKAQQMIQH